MQEWTATALKTMEAEFPTWHLLNSFSVFNLAGTTASRKRGQGCEEALAKLAKAFRVEESELKAQFIAVMPTAQALQKQCGFDNRGAWGAALQRLSATSAMRQKSKIHVLKEASETTFFNGIWAS